MMIGKSLLPITIVDGSWFNRLVMELDQKIKLPTRRTLTGCILPALKEERIKKATNAIAQSAAVALTFDLWMSHRSKDLFSIIYHTLSNSFVPTTYQLGLLTMDNTDGESIAKVLEKVITSYGLSHIVISYVFDGGANLKKYQSALCGLITCSIDGTSEPLHGKCWAQILSTTMSYAIGPDGKCDEGITFIDLKILRRKLQGKITYTKKSGKGSRCLDESCKKVNLYVKRLYSPVNTRFGSYL